MRIISFIKNIEAARAVCDVLFLILEPGFKPLDLSRMHQPHIFVQGVTDLKGQPSLVFTRGAPGSGKTTWAKYVYGEDAVFAADDYFDLFHNGEYVVSEIGDAHKWCQDKVFERLKEGKTAVVNNTNVSYNEMFVYLLFFAISSIL